MPPKTQTTKKVLIFQRALLPYSETFIKEQALALKEWKPVLAGESFIKNGLPLNEIEHLSILPEKLEKFHRLFYKLCKLFDIAYPPIKKRLRSLNIDIIHAHFGTSGVDIWPYAKALKIPLVVTLHGYDITIHPTWWKSGRGGLSRILYPRRLKALSEQSTTSLIAVSNAAKNYAKQYDIAENKITVLYIGIDTNRFLESKKTLREKPNRILFVGRLTEKKGAEYLIKAFPSIAKKVPNVELVIVGDGELYRKLKRMAEKTSAQIKFKGALSTEQVINEMHQAKVLCLPSTRAKNGDSEGFGLVILEAMACGLPAVTSASGGAEEGIIDTVNGFKFKERDTKDLARKISYILSNENIAEQISKKARPHVEKNFELKFWTEKLEIVYSNLKKNPKTKKRKFL